MCHSVHGKGVGGGLCMMSLPVCLPGEWGLSREMGLCPGGEGKSVWGEVCFCLGGLCLEGSVWGGSLSRGDLCLGVPVQGGSLSEGGVAVRESPPPYGKERAVRILLECILVIRNGFRT